MKNRDIENPFGNHRGTEIAEDCFVFAHRETAMAKDISSVQGRWLARRAGTFRLP